MKRFLLIVMAMLLSAISFDAFGGETDNQMKLTELWKEYTGYVGKDLPQKRLAVLTKIREQALEKKYAADYYNACMLTSMVRSSVNWKDRDAAEEEFDKAVEAFGLPVMTMFHKMQRESLQEAISYAEKNVSELAKTDEKWFQERWISKSSLNGYILSLIENDAQFAAWAAALGSVAVSESLKSCLDVEYPVSAVYEFVSAEKNVRNMTAHAEKYDGKAASLLSREFLVGKEFRDLNNDGHTTSDQYRDFYAKCLDLEKIRKSYKGDEAKLAECVYGIRSVINSLESHNANVYVDGETIKVEFRNLDNLNVVVKKDGKKVWSTTVVNRKKSFYVSDEVEVAMPKLDDGKYGLVCTGDGVDKTLEYTRTTLSAALRKDSKGTAIYVADYKTGKPVSYVNLILKSRNKEVTRVNGFAINGFTYLPESVASRIANDDVYSLECSLTDSNGRYRCSKELYLRSTSAVPLPPNYYTSAELFLDRSAFLPGETLQFKGLLYRYGKDGYKVEPDKTVIVKLLDAENNKVDEKRFKTNAFGSVAGSFDLPTGARNGIFCLEMRCDGEVKANRGFRVDEFVLPTFDVRFDRNDNVYLVGDTVRIKGYAASYSGHSLSSAKIKAIVTSSYREESKKEFDVEVAADGSFVLETVAAGTGYHNVEVRVTDSTGETLSFDTSFVVMNNISINVELENGADASLPNVLGGGHAILKVVAGYDKSFVKGANGPIDVVYRIVDSNGKVVSVGTMDLGKSADVDMSALPSGTYKVCVDATAKKADGTVSSANDELTIYKVSDNDKAFFSDAEAMFRVVGESNGTISLQACAGQGPIWACVEIFGTGNVLLRSEMVNLSGKLGESGSAKLLTYGYSEKWPDAISLNVFYFKNGHSGEYSHVFRRKHSVNELPLSISRFVDMAMPATRYSVLLKSSADAEALVSVFDKSTETIWDNRWSKIYHAASPDPYVRYDVKFGYAGAWDYYVDNLSICLEDNVPRTLFKSASIQSMAAGLSDNMDLMETAEEAIPWSLRNGAFDSMADAVTIREDFAKTVAFEPFLYTDGNGEVNVEFTTSDKLSTYVFSVFAHDKDVNTAVLRKEFKVTLPVKVSVVEPQVLYAGDHYVVKANLSSTSDEVVKGRVALYLYNTDKHETAKPIDAQYAEVAVDAHGAMGVEFETDVPDVDKLGLKIVFIGKEGEVSVSDAVFVSVPVRKPVQTVREAHSSVFFSGQDRNALVSELRGMFVNVPGDSAVLSERTIMDLVREAIPEKISTGCRNAISVSETLYASVLAKSLGMSEVDGSLLNKLLACRNEDGGFGWYENMTSSPMVTAIVLDRAGSLAERGLESGIDSKVLAKAVEYLDKSMFGKSERPRWCGGISLEQYLFVRAHYADVKLAATPKSDIRKAIRGYLVPKKARGMNGYILGKARRMRTLAMLLASDKGISLANSLGVKLSAGKKMTKSLMADKESLMEYAVAHKSGGKYYPNAVMPFRGLMESELYAHSMLCDLFRDLGEDKLADEIRIWIMVQKETQQWRSDPGYIEAISSVMDGSPEMKEISVLILSGETELPFGEIKAAGNGFGIEVVYKRADGSVIKSGDILSVGEKVISECKIWNEENRSFVHLDVPRPSSLRPENQLSGHIGWWYRALARSGYSYTPQGYRNVYAGGTEYFFDAYPEENTTITESYFVTQAGVFATPIAAIESLYAPHYVANGGYTGMMQSR